MFEDRVSVVIPKERKVLKKRFCGKEVQIYETISKDEILYCVKTTLDLYDSDTFVENQDMFLTPVEVFANIDISVAQLCTNINVEGLEYPDMCSMGLNDFLRKNVKGYEIIVSAVIIGIQHIHTVKMLGGIDHIATIDELEETEKNLTEIVTNGVPENVKDLMMTQVVENKAVAELYEKLSNLKTEESEVVPNK